MTQNLGAATRNMGVKSLLSRNWGVGGVKTDMGVLKSTAETTKGGLTL